MNEWRLTAAVFAGLALLSYLYALLFSLGFVQGLSVWVFVFLTYLVGALIYPSSPDPKIEGAE